MVFPLVASATVHTNSISIHVFACNHMMIRLRGIPAVVALNRRRLYLGSGGRGCEDHAVHSGGMLGFVFMDVSPKSNAFGMGSSMLTWNPNETGLKWMFGETTISYVKICSISIG